ncbi:MAG TPA: helix-turn-helix domain-containing protein [Allosphingosinicella sp.]|nr:helix-turn-helix domain-containing protein [Allosphingosinicella sp.]
MRQDDCGGCERRDACASLFAGLFGPGGAFARRPEPRRERKRPASFLAFLGQVAQSIEAGAQARAERGPSAPPSALRTEIERRIEPLLATGGVGIEQVARQLGLSRQTLYRRLKAEGATFEELLDGLRHRLALRLIRDERLSVKEAAYRLGFSDPAAFSRAFKRWTGSSPSSIQR